MENYINNVRISNDFFEKYFYFKKLDLITKLSIKR